MANLAIHRQKGEEMRQERMRYDQILQQAAAQQAREANKGKAREWNRDDLGYDSEPERTLLRRRREARRRARQAALEQQLNMAAKHHDDNLNLENNQN
ncbi:hypothetical protein PIB30_082416 [Stylosanthes scabra]|uniref:Uncharacterized protein n=1 Tax=Stylosanthes scabra TaxID=79078 RepID=A0ABU6ZQJ8_9FABA|nr:hypothetical protein [Stylosanthes scabra]